MRVVCLLILSLMMLSCASTKVTNINDQENLVMYDDEKNLWLRVKELEEDIQNSGSVYQDEPLTQYVNDVLTRIVGKQEEKYQVDLKVYILKDPWFNAFILPTGSMYVHTSVLANLENEAQLATILSHEVTHFFHRHSLKNQRNLINVSAFYGFFNITAGGASGIIGGVLGSSMEIFRILGSLGIQGAVYGYSRDIERDADQKGFQLMVEAGYDPRESKKTFEKLSEATKEEKIKTPYFYNSHPRVQERIKNFDEFISQYQKSVGIPLDGIRNEEGYAQHMTTVLLDNAEMDISRGKYKYAKKQIERFIVLDPVILKARANDLLGQANLGQYYLDKSESKKSKKKKKDEEDLTDYLWEARKAFETAMNVDPTYADSQLHLAMLYFKKGEKSAAKPHFEKYLELKPDAMDADYVRGYMNE